MSKTYSKTRILVECALMIAIGTVLSNIKFFTLPNGGSVTLLSMLPFVHGEELDVGKHRANGDHQGAFHQNTGLGIGFGHDEKIPLS